MADFKVIHEKNVFNKALTIREGEIITGENNYKRLGVDREDAAAVFILNTDSDKVILTRQFRYPVYFKTNERILEIVAGKIHHGEQPLIAALREAEEETGYKISPANLKFLMSCFSSPGYSSERFVIYYATVTNSDKISKGGGVSDEDEYIEVVEMDRKEFDSLVKDAALQDAKTYLAGLFLLTHNIIKT